MTDRAVETSPQLYARIGGALYLIIILIGSFDEAYVRNRIIVPGDAAATAANFNTALTSSITYRTPDAARRAVRGRPEDIQAVSAAALGSSGGSATEPTCTPSFQMTDRVSSLGQGSSTASP